MRHRRSLIALAFAGLFGIGAALACHDTGTAGPEVTDIDLAREKAPGNLTAVNVELLGPAPGEVDEGDPYNVRSGGPQQVWRDYHGDWMNLEARDFPVTLAFSRSDSIAMTDPDARVEGECPVVHDWLFGNENLEGLQERTQPVTGLFTFGFDGTSAFFALDVPDPFGDGYTYHIWLAAGPFYTGDLTVEDGPTGTVFTIEGSFVSIGQWGHSKSDPYKLTKAFETPWCKVHLADFTLVVSE